MNFLALLLGLAVERALTHLFKLREFRWLDPLFDLGFRRLGSASWLLAVAGVLGLVAVLVIPVAALGALLWDEFLQIPIFLFSVLVLLFSLGPRDLDDEVEDYLVALESGEEESRQRIAKEILEREPPAEPAARNDAVERGIYLQANNRIFAVVFWFLVFGPAGAWAFRVIDLMRRRTEYQLERPEPGISAGAAEAVRQCHGIFAWVPSRLLVAGYVLAGNFDNAVNAWRDARVSQLSLAEATGVVVTRVGVAAVGRESPVPDEQALPERAIERIRAARSLVIRTLWLVWCPILALMTLYDWVT